MKTGFLFERSLGLAAGFGQPERAAQLIGFYDARCGIAMSDGGAMSEDEALLLAEGL